MTERHGTSGTTVEKPSTSPRQRDLSGMDPSIHPLLQGRLSSFIDRQIVRSGRDSTYSDESYAATLARAQEGVISVALVEDNRLVREGITSLLNRFTDLQVSSANPCDRSLSNCEDSKEHPQVILLDIGPDVGNSLKLARSVQADFPDSAIVILGLLPSHGDVLEFISAGVSGFILKDASIEDVADTIRSVAAGVDVLPQAMTATLFSEIAKEPVLLGSREIDPGSVRLTAREAEVSDLVARGMSNKAIGKELHVSTHTVKSHLRNIMDKLALDSRLQLASYVLQMRSRGPWSEGLST